MVSVAVILIIQLQPMMFNASIRYKV